MEYLVELVEKIESIEKVYVLFDNILIENGLGRYRTIFKNYDNLSLA